MLNAKIKRAVANYISTNLINRYNPEISLENWFYHWLYFQNMGYTKDYGPKNCYYEFGTGWGGTLRSFLKASKRFSKENNFDITQIKIVLFDSFQGLPEITAKEDNHREWGKGKFAYSKDYIAKIIVEHGFPLQNVTFIEGFFENTLNSQTLERLNALPPSIVTVDVDYYSSTKLALDFITPLLKSGTVFYFDDLFSFFLHPEMGQVKAIKEFNDMGAGTLNALTHANYSGQCYAFTSKSWEFTEKK